MATGGIALDGTSQYLELASAVVTSFPMSMSLWLTMTSDVSAFPICQQAAASDRQAAAFIYNFRESKSAYVRNPGANSSATKTTAPHASATLQLMVVVFESTTSRAVYFGNNTAATNTETRTDDLNLHDRLTIGARHTDGGAADLFLPGTVCEAHIYNAALTSSDVTTLLTTAPDGGGIASWVDGWTLADASTLTSIGGTRTLTAVGSPTTGSVTLPYTRSGGGGSFKAAWIPRQHSFIGSR